MEKKKNLAATGERAIREGREPNIGVEQKKKKRR